MKRSEINTIIDDVKQFCQQQKFYLPPFAYWTLDDWREKGEECNEIRVTRMGWDVTDFDAGRFNEIGLTLFTIRNGHPTDERYTKPYCEKLLIIGEEQITPAHHHRLKTEDIINRGGGNLMIKLRNSSPKGELFDTPVTVTIDGTVYTFESGTVVKLTPGESITLPPFLHHSFWGERGHGTVLSGEVSAVNDDLTDNISIPEMPRFSEIEEDEPPVHLLCGDYEKFVPMNK